MENFQRDNIGAFDFGRPPPLLDPSHPLFGQLPPPIGPYDPNHPLYIPKEEPQPSPYDPTDPNIPASTQVEISIPQANPATTTPPLVHTTPFQTPFAQNTSPFTPFTIATAAHQPSLPNPPISQISASLFGQPQQYTTGMSPMGPSNPPFITPSLFTSAQSTIPSFPLGPWSSMPSTTNPQATTLTPQSYQTPQATTNVLPRSQVTQAPTTILPSFQI